MLISHSIINEFSLYEFKAYNFYFYSKKIGKYLSNTLREYTRTKMYRVDFTNLFFHLLWIKIFDIDYEIYSIDNYFST